MGVSGRISTARGGGVCSNNSLSAHVFDRPANRFRALDREVSRYCVVVIYHDRPSVGFATLCRIGIDVIVLLPSSVVLRYQWR